MNLKTTLSIFALFAASAIALAQGTEVPSIGQEELASRLMVWVPPVYPAIAQTAHVQGDVVVKIEVDPSGLVRSANAVKGPAMLRQVTVDALKQCRYVGFKSGNASVAVSGIVVVTFTLKDKPEVHTAHESTATGTYTVSLTFPPPDNHGQPDEEIANRFDPLWETCSRGVIAHQSNSDTADACKKAAAVADEFPADRRYVERRLVYVYAATVLANIHDLPDALIYAEKAIAVVKLGHDDDSGNEAAYSIRGQLLAFSGDMAHGDEDISIAEDFGRKMPNSKVLKRDLEFHAELLRRMNRPAEAQAKADEAAKL